MYTGCKESLTLQVFNVNLTHPLSVKYTLLNTQFQSLTCSPYYWFIELPWDQPTKKYKEYYDWINGGMHRTPWTKIDRDPLGACYDFWHFLLVFPLSTNKFDLNFFITTLHQYLLAVIILLDYIIYMYMYVNVI